MGLSASQARLIALTARMSDVEYEGQQINQQRLAISNKISDIYSQMEGMVVPTPPSPYNFMKTDYVGKDPSGNEIGLQADPQGNFTVNAPVKGATLTSEGLPQNVKSTEMEKPKETGRDIEVQYHPLKKTRVQCTSQEVLQALSGVTDKDGSGFAGTWSLPEGVKPGDIQYDTTYLWDNGQTTKEVEEDVYDSEGKKTGTTTKTVTADKDHHDKVDYSNFRCSTELYNGAYEIDTSQTKTKTIKANEEAPASYSALGEEGGDKCGGAALKYQMKGADGQYGNEVYPEDVSTAASTGYNDTAKNNLIGKFKDNGDPISADDFDEMGRLTYKGKIFTEKNQEKIGETPLYSYEDAKSQFGGDSAWSDFETRIRRAAGTACGADNALKDGAVDDELKNWRVVKNGNSFSAYRIDENGQAQKYKAADDIYNDTFKGEPVISKDGSIGGVTYTDADGVKHTVSAQKREEVDSVAMQAATAEYEAAKADYDKEQDRLNHETSKWQLEDKKLDLKLKRLDTERNALNTEIDAVKKVIQDATDHGFKTFSG